MVLHLEADELPVILAALTTTPAPAIGSADATRQAALLRAVQALTGHAPFRLHIERGDAELLRACVTMSIGLRGYIVGRPAALAAMTRVRQQLDRLLKSSAGDVGRVWRTC